MAPNARPSLAQMGVSMAAVSVMALPHVGWGAVMGVARALPYPEAVQRSRAAAEAVLARAGSEGCLRGRLTNALLGLASSCEAVAERNALCRLADAVVLRTGAWDRAFLEASARELLQLSATPQQAPAEAPAPSR